MKKMPELNLQERTRDPADPMLQPPELMQGYLKLLIEKTGQRTLRRRWGDKFNRILDYYNFLTYRIQMRTTACARLKEELKAQRDDQLNQNTGHGTASLLLPAHLR
jgi:hypothetical protein